MLIFAQPYSKNCPIYFNPVATRNKTESGSFSQNSVRLSPEDIELGGDNDSTKVGKRVEVVSVAGLQIETAWAEDGNISNDAVDTAEAAHVYFLRVQPPSCTKKPQVSGQAGDN